MIEYITLYNFKSFDHIKFDLRDKKGNPKKLAFVYGENGSGKSNLMSAFYFITQTFDTLSSQDQIAELHALDIDIDDEKIKEKIINEIIKQNLLNLSELIKINKTIDCDDNMKIELGFFIGNNHGVYTLEFNDEKVIYEELKYQISERIGSYFKIDENNSTLSPTIFYDKNYNTDLKNSIEKYWGKHTFMSILFNEMKDNNNHYIDKRIDNHLIKLISDFRKISVLCKYNNSQRARVSIPFDFLKKLDEGTIKDCNNIELKAFENALNDFFTSLYSDVKKAYYKFNKATINNDLYYEYKLYFSKMMNGMIKEIPFSLESTGTQKLLDIFPFLFSALMKGTIFVDEIESGIHDILITNLIEYLSESINGQFIATTHNTLLMKSLPQEYIYIIQSDSDGNKKIVCINEYNFRTQKTHNKQNKYLNGSYKGIPYVGYLDFEELVDDVKNHLNSSLK